MAAEASAEELVDYDEDEEPEKAGVSSSSKSDNKKAATVSAIHTSGFRDFLLKPEILQAITDCGFEHPSEVQHECIPQAILGMDIICQAKSGMGKTAVFVIATLQQIDPSPGVVDTLVLCHIRELAYQICQEYERFAKYMPAIKTAVLFGGINIKEHIRILQEEQPNIIVGTPGRVKQLVEEKHLKLDHLKRFVLDECDKMLDVLDMRRDVQAIFRATPHEKQTLMFSATIGKEVRQVCRKFAQHPLEIFIDDESKLTLHGLRQHFVKLAENQKNRKLNDILDALEFNQVVIFVSSARRAIELNRVLLQSNFPSMCIHSMLKQEDRLERFNKFKDYKARILVCTDVFGRGVDIERVNIVINYDMPDARLAGAQAAPAATTPAAGAGAAGAANKAGKNGIKGKKEKKADGKDAAKNGAAAAAATEPTGKKLDEQTIQASCDTYLHRVGRAGRFGTKGLAISFVASPDDGKILEAVQSRFEVEITEMPATVDSSTYMNS